MPSAASFPDDWSVPDGSRGGLQRHRVDRLPSQLVVETDLVPLLSPTTVVEVWVPTHDPDSSFPQARNAGGQMTAFRIEFTDQVYAVEYQWSEADQSMGWYWALGPMWTHNDPREARDVALADHVPLSKRMD